MTFSLSSQRPPELGLTGLDPVRVASADRFHSSWRETVLKENGTPVKRLLFEACPICLEIRGEPGGGL
jgi:hypothetical protein